MSSEARHTKFTFEGEELTVAEIHRRYLPTVPTGTIHSRLITSGATTMKGYIDWLSRPVPKKKPSQVGITDCARPSTKRFSRDVREKVDRATGEKGCNYCHRMRPMDKLSVVGTNRLICDLCKSNRKKPTRNSTIR